MARERVTKTVIYKRVNFFSGDKSLQELLKEATQKKTTVKDMKQSLGGSGKEKIFHIMGEILSEGNNGMFFGTLMSYKPGTHPMAVIDDDNASSITIEKYAFPQGNDGKARELLNCVLFFGCLDNHLVLMQSYLKSEHLENYLQWLLHDAKVLEGDNTLTLMDSPSKEIVEKVEEAPIKSVTIADNLIPPLEDQEGNSSPQTMVVSGKKIPDKGMLKAVLSFLSQDTLAKLPLDKIGDDNLEFSLIVKYKGKTSEGGQKVLNAIGHAFRHIDSTDTKIELADGSSIKGNDIKLRGDVRVTTYDGHPASNEVYEELRKWLLQKIHSSTIPPSS